MYNVNFCMYQYVLRRRVIFFNALPLRPALNVCCGVSQSLCCVGELWRVPLFMEHPGYINASFANVSVVYIV